MDRRGLIVALIAAALPIRVRAQKGQLPVIGFLVTASPDLYTDRLVAFRQGLKESGYIEGQNVQVEYRWAEGQSDRLPRLASDLVQRHVTLIVALGSPSAQAAKAATTTIPIVFGVAIDPIEAGLGACRT